MQWEEIVIMVSAIKTETIKINKGKPIFVEGDKVEDIALIISGKVNIIQPQNQTNESDNNFRVGVLAEGYMIGVPDLLLKGTYLNNYVAASNCIVLLLNINNSVDLENYFNTEKDYYTYAIGTNSRMIKYLKIINENVNFYLRELQYIDLYLAMNCEIFHNTYNFERKANQLVMEKGKRILGKIQQLGLPLPQFIDFSYFMSDLGSSFEDEIAMDDVFVSKNIEYFSAMADMKTKLCKDFFAENSYISDVHLEQSTITYNLLRDGLIKLVNKVNQLFININNKNEDNPYSECIKCIASLERRGDVPKTLIDTMTQVKDVIDDVKMYLNTNLNFDITNGNNDYQDLYNLLFMKEIEQIAQNQEAADKASIFQILEHLSGSAKKIVDYSEIDSTVGEQFLNALEKFRKLKDKYSLDSSVKTIRKVINATFYKIYEKVYIKSKRDTAPLDRIIEMFLDYAYMDERLLESEQLVYLYNLNVDTLNDEESQVFTLTKWLDSIFIGKRMPSINEFDLDYADNLRELRKKRQYSEVEQKEYLDNMVGRVEYEIRNMIKSTMKTCNGQILAFVPILFSDSIYGDIERVTNTAKKISGLINDITEIDYSIFYREILFYMQDNSIDREYVMKEVRPDIIVVPTFGSRVIAWQDIASRNRALPGRIIVPMFANDNFYDMLLQAMGQYRWDLCRSVMGVSWNNIQVKSLTSEYSDYLQFFRKNQALSEVVRDKIKQQITNNRNINRDIFAEDYVTWMKYEVTGAVRLNKVVREIMVNYCTPSKTYRENLVEQNIFRELILKLNIKKEKKVRELENRYARIEKNIRGPLPEDLEENLRYYRDLS